MTTKVEELLEREDVKSLLSRKSNLPGSITTIETDEQMADADARLMDIKAMLKQVEEVRMSITRPIEANKKEVIDFFRSNFENTLKPVVDELSRAIRIYQQEQERKRKEEAAREAEKARKRQEQLDARAEAAEEKGQHERASNLRTNADSTVAVAAKEAPKAKGVQRRENWQFEILDEQKLPPEYLQPDLKSIGGVVKAMKGKTNIPGIRVYDANSLEALKQA